MADKRGSGRLVWITGLPGSGKTTIAKKLVEILRQQGVPNLVYLDGDQMRELFGNDLGHDMADRLKNAYRITRLCQFLTSQGLFVVCATNSHFYEIHDFNRQANANYYEILVHVDDEVLLARNQKNLYKGDVKNVWNKDQQPQLPKAPHLELKNNDIEDLEINLNFILNMLK